MLAKRVEAIPENAGWIFEPKWDGFRAVVFRAGEDVLIQSRDGKPLNRYFPELLEPLRAQLPERCVLDGEVVIVRGGIVDSGKTGSGKTDSGKAGSGTADDGLANSGTAGSGTAGSELLRGDVPAGSALEGESGLDFDALQLRVHPAASRVRLLAEQTPASVVFFDALWVGERDLRGEPFAERRAVLEATLAGCAAPLHLTPATRDGAVAEDWFRRFEGAGLDGVMAKPETVLYLPDKRAMLKVKHERDCDCVVAGFRWHKEGEGTAIGSLLLGLYDAGGALQHVGVCASFTAAKRRELVEFLAPYREGALASHPWRGWAEASATGRMPGGQSRWNAGKDLSWEALRPELVVEVAYEHMQGDRFRHLAHFRRWRVEKQPRECTYAQLEVVAPQELAAIFAGGR